MESGLFWVRETKRKGKWYLAQVNGDQVMVLGYEWTDDLSKFAAIKRVDLIDPDGKSYTV